MSTATAASARRPTVGAAPALPSIPAGAIGEPLLGPAPVAPGLPATAPILRIPSLGRRVAIGSLRAALAIGVLVLLPWWLLGFFGGFGVTTPLSIAGLAVLGCLFAGVGALRYIARPTRAFGPLTILGSLVSVAYLLYLIPIASIAIHPSSDINVAIDFGRFLQYCLIAPVFGIAAGSVTTLEDFARPGERIAHEYGI